MGIFFEIMYFTGIFFFALGAGDSRASCELGLDLIFVSEVLSREAFLVFLVLELFLWSDFSGCDGLEEIICSDEPFLCPFSGNFGDYFFLDALEFFIL